MRRGIRNTSLPFLLLLATACGGGGHTTTDQERFDELVRYTRAELERQGVPGAAVAVVIDGEVRFSAGVGTKRVGADDPVHPETLFGIGSTTKMMVATALLSLHDSGAFLLDDPITTRVPEFRLAEPHAADTGRIHLRHLLTHTAGIIDGAEYRCSESLAEFAAGRRLNLIAEPGTTYSYSGFGYDLAGRALEVATGQPFAAVMRARVFDPAGMTTTTFDSTAAMALDHSFGHMRSGSEELVEVDLDSTDCPFAMPSGMQTYTTAPELARFAAALVNGRNDLLLPPSISELLDPLVQTYGFPGERSALGLNTLGGPPEDRVYYHGGNDDRFTSSVVIVPGRRFAAVAIMNVGGAGPNTITARALELFMGSDEGVQDPYLGRGDYAVPASSYPRFVGTYVEPYEMGRAVVSLVDGELVADLPDLPGAPRAELHPVVGDGDAATFGATSAAFDHSMSLVFLFDGDPDHAQRIVTRQGIFARSP